MLRIYAQSYAHGDADKLTVINYPLCIFGPPKKPNKHFAINSIMYNGIIRIKFRLNNTTRRAHKHCKVHLVALMDS